MNNVSPDKITLSVNIKLKREKTRVFKNDDHQSPDAMTLLERNCLSCDCGIKRGDRIFSNESYNSGYIDRYTDHEIGITVVVRGEIWIIKIILNVPKLSFDLDHNGRMVNSQDCMDKAINRLERWLDTYAERPFHFEVHEIELAVNVPYPYAQLEPFFLGAKLKRSHQDPWVRPGKGVGMNRDRRSDGKRPEFTFHMYDKKREFLDTKSKFTPENLPEHVTRLEFSLRGERLEREFGGKDLRNDVTFAKMQEVYWRLFKQEFDALPALNTQFGCNRIDMLAQLIRAHLVAGEHWPQDQETPFAYWHRVRKNPAKANKEYREASLRALASLERKLSDLVNPQTPTVEIY